MRSVRESMRFILIAPALVVILAAINLMTWSGHWWVQWPALGLGIAWVISLLRVLRAALLAGGLAALGVYLYRRR